MTTQKKLLKALAIVVVAIQIPMLILWNITLDALKFSSSEITYIPGGGYDQVFQWDKFGSTLLLYGPILLALTTCLALSVLGLIFILRKKHATISTVCFYAATVLSCGFLCLAFAAPAVILGEENAYMLTLSEFMFYRYFGIMQWNIINIFPAFETIKFFIIDLLMVGSGVVCGLGIIDLIRYKAPSDAF